MRNVIKGKALKQRLLFLSFLYAAGSLILAYAFEYYMNTPPCALCIYQRIVLGAVVVCFPLVWFLFQKFPEKKFYLLIPFIYSVNLGIAAYHAGVEQHFFPPPTQCLSPSLSHHGDPDALRTLLLEKKNVPCDEISWKLFGLSMAAYNALCSLVLLLLWRYALGCSRKTTGEKS